MALIGGVVGTCHLSSTLFKDGGVNRFIVSWHVETQSSRSSFGGFCPSTKLRITLLYRWLPSILATEIKL